MFRILYFIIFYSIDAYQISLMRHAETINNKQNICTGQLDIPIIPNKINKLNIHFTSVLSSPMLRCKQTLNKLDIDNKVIYDTCFIECGYGELTGKTKDRNKFYRTFFNKPLDSDIYQSESIFEGGIRAYSCLKFHQQHSLLGNNILVLSHKNTLKGLWTLLKLEKSLNNKNIEIIYDLNFCKKNIEILLNNNKLPEFNNLDIETFQF